MNTHTPRSLKPSPDRRPRPKALVVILILGAVFSMGCWSMMFFSDIFAPNVPADRFAEGLIHQFYIANDEPPLEEYIAVAMATPTLSPEEAEQIVDETTEVIGLISENYGNMMGSAGSLPEPPQPWDGNSPTPTPVYIAGDVEMDNGVARVGLEYRTELDDPYGDHSGEADVAFCIELVPIIGSDGNTYYRWNGVLEAGQYTISEHNGDIHTGNGNCDSGIRPTPTPIVNATVPPGSNPIVRWPTLTHAYNAGTTWNCYAVPTGVTNPAVCGDPSDPNNETPYWHPAIDIDADYESLFNPFGSDGEVVESRYSGGTEQPGCGTGEGYGNLIVLADVTGEWSVWNAHLDSRGVAQGDIVPSGGVMGTTGNSGCSTGAHLHFEIRHWGTQQNPLNYLP